MKLEPGEILILEETITPEARAAVEPILDQLEDLKRDAIRLHGEFQVIQSKADYLNKLKWAMFDKYHPNTNATLNKLNGGKDAMRRLNWDAGLIGIVQAAEEADSDFPDIKIISGDHIPDEVLDAIKAVLSNLKAQKSKGEESTPSPVPTAEKEEPVPA